MSTSANSESTQHLLYASTSAVHSTRQSHESYYTGYVLHISPLDVCCPRHASIARVPHWLHATHLSFQRLLSTASVNHTSLTLVTRYASLLLTSAVHGKRQSHESYIG